MATTTDSGMPTQTLSSLALPGSQQNKGSAATSADSKPKKKICCACPDTKRLRDECMVENGEAACTKWINAHIECLRAEGFNV
ncbi:cytochrome c oxidase copper chaperone 1-like [Telopea speciosissima]|uniref:cytochrome c oxidase copper chaperone 1-like n=1 Tax=Telopea speciosissima TaxID=54955 RepID=UPI001CC8095D|nr:cytochrome c oxidase copper chaperone 1-like [Telopea speciosissima]